MVIRGVPVDVSEEELWMELKTSNPNLCFERDDIYRMKRRAYVEGAVQYINTTSVKISLRSMSIPSHVFTWKTRLEAAPYIPVIRQCYNCGQLSHSTKFCTNTPKCLTCGQDKHKAEAPCSNIPLCLNCGGKHCSLAKDCPEVILKRRITEAMALQNIDFNTAKRLISRGYSPTASPLGSDLTSPTNNNVLTSTPNSANFPPLPNGPIISGRRTLGSARMSPTTSTGTPTERSYAATAASNPEAYNSNMQVNLGPILDGLPEKALFNFVEFIKLFAEINSPLDSFKKLLAVVDTNSPPPDSQ